MIFVTELGKDLKEQVRTNRLLVLGVVLLAFGLMSPLLAKYTPELLRMVPGAEQFSGLVPKPTMLDAVSQFVKNVDQFGVLLALLLTMGAIAVEKDRGTAAMMLVKPLPRPVFVISKFIALVLIFGLTMLVASIGAYYYTVVLFSPPDLAAWMTLTGLMWVQVSVYVALTLFFSTLFKSQAAAAGLGFASLIVFAIIGSIPGLAPYIPDRLIAWGGSLFTPTAQPAWAALWISLGIILVSLVGAVLAFRKQEL